MSNAEKPTGAYVWCMGPVSAVAAPVPCASSGEWSGQGHREAAPGERAVASPGHWFNLDLDALMAHQLDACPAVETTTPIPPENGLRSNVQGMQQHAHLARLRGGLALTTLHWSRRGQGRQLRILAPYTTRRLPSASRRCSWGISFWPAGHRSVPSGWRAKSWPEKRPAFQAKPT